MITYFLFMISNYSLNLGYVFNDSLLWIWWYLLIITLIFIQPVEWSIWLGFLCILFMKIFTNYWVFHVILVKSFVSLFYFISVLLLIVYLMNLKLSYLVLNNYNFGNDMLWWFSSLEILLYILVFINDMFLFCCLLEVIILTVVMPSMASVREEGSYGLTVDYFMINLMASMLMWVGLLGIYLMVTSLDYNILNLIFHSMLIQGESNYIGVYILFIFLMIFIKLGIFPFHTWAINLYANLNSMSFLLLFGPMKIIYWIFFLIIYNLIVGFDLIFIWESLLFFGSVAYLGGLIGTIKQIKIKNFLIFSSSVYTGLFVICLNLTSDLLMLYSLFVYLNLYLILSFFLSVILIKCGNYNLLFTDCSMNSWHGHFKLIFLIVCLLMGLPPFFSFFFKYTFFSLLIANCLASSFLLYFMNFLFWCNLYIYFYYFKNLYLMCIA